MRIGIIIKKGEKGGMRLECSRVSGAAGAAGVFESVGSGGSGGSGIQVRRRETGQLKRFSNGRGRRRVDCSAGFEGKPARKTAVSNIPERITWALMRGRADQSRGYGHRRAHRGTGGNSAINHRYMRANFLPEFQNRILDLTTMNAIFLYQTNQRSR